MSKTLRENDSKKKLKTSPKTISNALRLKSAGGTSALKDLKSVFENLDSEKIKKTFRRKIPIHTITNPMNSSITDNAEERQNLAALVTRLFDRWELSTADQLELLGLSPTSRAMLGKYRKGTALPPTRDMLDRVGWLMAIHKSLRILYPHNPEICYSWVKKRNQMLGNLTPLEVMKEQGLIGLYRITRFLDYLREH